MAMTTIKVWDLPVRITHWLNVLSILVLSITGFYITDPIVTTHGPARDQFLMGLIRGIHFSFAFLFTVTVLFRVYWAFRGNRWARWSQLVPATRLRRHLFVAQVKYYTFLNRLPPAQIGHNPLAGVTYMAIYVLFFAQILTGFGLYSLGFEGGFWPAVFGWLPLTLGATTLRLIHYLVMWAFFAFTIHHVYSAILIDTEERSGLLSSIFTGYKSFTKEHLEETNHG
jgi:Ni/Fe-hydrogenase 1 B-type cytochrome subunit